MDIMKNIEEISKKSPFKIPENYFEEVTGKIITEAAAEVPEKSSQDKFIRLRPFLAIAASFTLLILLSYSILRIFFSETDKISSHEITMQEYSGSDLYDIDLLTLEETAGFYLVNHDSSDVAKAEIFDYLLYENLDESEIYELL